MRKKQKTHGWIFDTSHFSSLPQSACYHFSDFSHCCFIHSAQRFLVAFSGKEDAGSLLPVTATVTSPSARF